MKRQQGFSLIELIVVVAIILVLVAIAIPNLLKSKMAANEASATASIRTIGSANAIYFSLYHEGFAGTLAQLGPTSAACATSSSGCADLLDSTLSGINPPTATPIKAGYRFTYYAPNANPTANSPNPTWATVAAPILPGNSGVKTYCIDQRAPAWKDTSGNQTIADPTGCAAKWPSGGSIGPL